ncbi:MAG: glutathione S-transferase N-terminal domain-containing protein [Candidatus Manganitrophaceae bacterium]
MGKMTLYNLESCPYCKMVRDKLQELDIDHEKIEVPPARPMRKEVFEVSGQYTVPVLVDGEVVLDDEEKILPYLEEKYGKQSQR